MRDALYSRSSVMPSLLSYQSFTLARLRDASLLANIMLILVLAAGHRYYKLKGITHAVMTLCYCTPSRGLF